MPGGGFLNLPRETGARVILKPGRQGPLQRGRRWVYRTEIDRIEGDFQAGDTVQVFDAYGRFVAKGFINLRSMIAVRVLTDDRGRSVREAGPSTPVSVIGLKALPAAGDIAEVVGDVHTAQQVAELRGARQQRQLHERTAKATLLDLRRALGEKTPELKLVLKADVGGSLDALRGMLTGLLAEDAKVVILHAGIGAITESDVHLAAAGDAQIVAFNVPSAPRAHELARQLRVRVREHRIVYELADDVRRELLGLLAPTEVEVELGAAEVRQVFTIGRLRVAGCRVLRGLMRRGARARLERGGTPIWTGTLESLRRFKDDVREVREGFECGLTLQGFDRFEVGDVVVALETRTKPAERAAANVAVCLAPRPGNAFRAPSGWPSPCGERVLRRWMASLAPSFLAGGAP